MTARALKTEEYRITQEPYYASQGDEIALFEAAFRNQLPVLLKGPTGCGKTRFMRVLPMEKTGELLEAPAEFCLAISYSPGYQSVLKDLKQSTRQRFVALEFSYPKPELEKEIVRHESGVNDSIAAKLVKFAGMTRNLKGSGLDERRGNAGRGE